MVDSKIWSALDILNDQLQELKQMSANPTNNVFIIKIFKFKTSEKLLPEVFIMCKNTVLKIKAPELRDQ